VVTEVLANKVNKLPPQDYNLPIITGFKAYGKCVYSKTQESIVLINAAIQTSSGYFPSMSTVSTLPEGYRPKYDTEISVLFSGSDVRPTGIVQILRDGTIRVICNSDSQSIVFFSVSFLAAQ